VSSENLEVKSEERGQEQSEFLVVGRPMIAASDALAAAE